MFKVECPGCKAPYQVDERRVPSSGLKMRCPKCGTSFKVDPPEDPRRTGPSPVLGGGPAPAAAPAAPAPGSGKAAPVAARAPAAIKGTMIGVAPSGAPGPAAPVPARAKTNTSTLLGVPPPSVVPQPGGKPPPMPNRKGPAAPADPYAESDLPAIKGAAAAKPAVPAPKGPPPPSSGLDLPSAVVPKAAQRAPQAPAPIELDLPASTAPRSVAPDSGLELDLPAIAAPAAADLPAAARQRGFGAGPALDVDLPSLPNERGNVQLEASRPGVDLPSVAGRMAAPSMSTRQGGFGEPDLPSLSAGLPASRVTSDEMEDAGELELPSISNAALPAIAPDAGLPSLSQAGLPSVGGAGLPVVSAGLPVLGGPGLPDLKQPSGAGTPSLPPDFGTLDLVPPAPSVPPARLPGGGGGGGGFGELELPLIGTDAPPAGATGASGAHTFGAGGVSGAHTFGSSPLDDDDPFGEADMPIPETQPGSLPTQQQRPRAAAGASDKLVRQAGGGVAFGEVNLGGDDEAEVPLEAEAGRRGEDDMEFGGVPQENSVRPAAAASAQVHAEAPTGTALPKPKRSSRSRKRALQVFGVLFVVFVGGASLALVPSVGPFGAYWITDRLKADEYEKLVASTAASARSAMQADVYPRAKETSDSIDTAVSRHKRVPGLRAYAAFNAYLTDLRFVAEPSLRARAKVLLDELAEEADADVPALGLARAARSAADGQLPRARQALRAILGTSKRDVDALLLAGEIELKAEDAAAAVEAWTAAQAAEQSARTTFGLSRARQLGGDNAAAEKLARQTLEQSPGHVGARLLIARLLIGDRRKGAEVEQLLDAVAKEPSNASPGEMVGVQTLLGDLNLGRSRITQAEAAYNEALKIDPKSGRALTGLGEALFRAARFSEAQARFEAASQANSADMLAKIGIAKSKLSLERVHEAGVVLQELRKDQPKSALVAYWLGRVQEAQGQRKQAEALYKEASEADPSEPAVVDAYIALALLYNQDGRTEDAQKVLAGARQKLPNLPAIHKAIGDVAVSQGRHADAITEFSRALELDPEDVSAKFRLGSALRRDRKFEQATKALDEVAEIDREYPGLALERGLLYEASGRTEEALKAYETALAKAPKDPDLMLRVGCGKASLGHSKQAETLLRDVLSQRPTSSEAHHCLGRALLSEGTRLADATRLLDRAVELDANRAEYHLYAGWAANEAGNVPRAERALTEALKLDQGLADAYWQRGVLRQRQGAVRDAIADLTKALELRPSRTEAHAALAEAYYDMGKEQQALSEWQLAVQAQPDNATWRFRYGRLLSANHMNDAARDNLATALKLVANVEQAPRWVWEAHHLLARALGLVPDAVPHWEQFLKLGPRDSPYRAEAKAALQKLNRPWTGD